MDECDELLEEHPMIHITLGAREVESFCDISTTKDQEVCFEDFA